MTCHYPNLGSASAMMKKIPFAVRPIRGTTQIWLVTRHQYGISSPVPSQTSFRGETSGGLPNIGCFLNLVPRVLSGFDGRRERTLGRGLFFCSYCRFWLLLTHSTHLLKDSAHNPTEPAPRPDPVQYHRRLLLCRLCNLHQPMSLWKKTNIINTE